MIYGRFYQGTKHHKRVELRDSSDVWHFMSSFKRGYGSLKETYKRHREENFELVCAEFRIFSVMPSQGPDTFIRFDVRNCDRESLDKLQCLYEDYILGHDTHGVWRNEMLGEWPRESRRTATEIRLQQESYYSQARQYVEERTVRLPTYTNSFDPLNKPKQKIKDVTLAMKDSEDINKQLEMIAAKGRKHMREYKVK